MPRRGYGQYGGVVAAAELIGERWALLIVRDLLVGPRRYTDLREGLPHIPTNILAARLKGLQAGGIVQRVPVRQGGVVYDVTSYGRELEPIVLALARWGLRVLDEPGDDDVLTSAALSTVLRAVYHPDVARAAGPTDYEVHVGDIVLRLSVGTTTLVITQMAPPAPPSDDAPPVGAADIVITAKGGIRRLLAGEQGADAALAAGDVAVAFGDPALWRRFTRTFRVDSVAAGRDADRRTR